jgi:NDP-sugar pyrophosphorylase family protein
MLRSDPVLVMNGDSYFDADVPAFFAWHVERHAEGSILLCEVADVARFGQVQSDAAGAVVAFDEKGSGRGRGWINAGIYLLSRRIVESIPSGRPVSLEREVLPAWIGRGLLGCRAAGRFLDIGTPESYAAAEAFFGERRR